MHLTQIQFGLLIAAEQQNSSRAAAIMSITDQPSNHHITTITIEQRSQIDFRPSCAK